MKKLVVSLILWTVCMHVQAQFIVVTVLWTDYIAAPKRVIIIPGQVKAMGRAKNKITTGVLPNLIDEEADLLEKWGVSENVMSVFNPLTVLHGVSEYHLFMIYDELGLPYFTLASRNQIEPIVRAARFMPGLGKYLQNFLRLQQRLDDMRTKILVMIAGGAISDGAGYLRVAAIKLAREYIEVYEGLRHIHYNIKKMKAFAALAVDFAK